MASEFNTQEGAAIERELLIAYLNTGTKISPTWSPIGTRVEDSSESFDWSEETTTDILGQIRTVMKKPIINQSFDPCRLDKADTAITKLWEMAIKDQDYVALSNQDMLIVHLYAGTKDTAMFAERFESCAIKPTGLGGQGGGTIEMPIDVTYGGVRTKGHAAINDGTVTFTAE